jgi:hypothetical protein
VDGRFGQALRRNLQATPSATLRGTLADFCRVPALHSNRLGAGLRPSPTLFFGYRVDAGKAHLSRAPYLLTIALSHRPSNIHRGLRGVAPPAPPLLRVVCSASGCAASSPLPAVECQPSPVAFSYLATPMRMPIGTRCVLSYPALSPLSLRSRGAPSLSHCGARLRPRPPL